MINDFFLQGDETMKKQWAILLVVLPMTFMITLDSSIVNVALPTMARELGTTMAGIEWVVTSYLITICAFILLFGRFGDIIGKSRVFRIGIAVFTIGFLQCKTTRHSLFPLGGFDRAHYLVGPEFAEIIDGYARVNGVVDDDRNAYSVAPARTETAD